MSSHRFIPICQPGLTFLSKKLERTAFAYALVSLFLISSCADHHPSHQGSPAPLSSDSSDLSGGLRDGQGSGMAIDISGHHAAIERAELEALFGTEEEEEEINEEEEQGGFSLDLDSLLGDNAENNAENKAKEDVAEGNDHDVDPGVGVVFCEDASSDIVDEWTDCMIVSPIVNQPIPTKFTGEDSEENITKLTLAIHSLQTPLDADSQEELGDFLLELDTLQDTHEHYVTAGAISSSLLGSQLITSQALSRTHLNSFNIAKLPKALRPLAKPLTRPKFRHTANSFARSKFIRVAAMIVAVGSSVLYAHNRLTRHHKLHSIKFIDPDPYSLADTGAGEDDGTTSDDGEASSEEVSVYSTLQALMKRSGDSRGQVVDIENPYYALEIIELGIERVDLAAQQFQQQRTSNILDFVIGQ